MPTYEYVCEACGHEFERFQKISDDPVRVCPECGRKKVRRRISSGGGLVFKGPGFYATDYRKSPPPDGKSSDSAEPAKTDKSAKTQTGSAGGDGGKSDD